MAQSKPAAKVETRTYDSLVARAGNGRAMWRPRPLAAASGGALLAVVGLKTYRSDDAAATWRAVGALGVTGDPVALGADGGGRWWCLLRDGSLLVTTDDARTWTRGVDLRGTSSLAGDAVVVGAELAADGGGWAVLRGGHEQAPQSVLVVGSGAGWRRAGEVGALVDSASADSGQVVAIAGADVYRVAPAVGDFERVGPLQGTALNAIGFAGPRHGFIATGDGLVIETNDGGTTWLARPVAPGVTLEAIGALDADQAWVIGRDRGRDALFVSRDGGVTWRRAFEGTGAISGPARGPEGTLWLVDGDGRVWTAARLDAAWRPAGSLTGAPAPRKDPPKDAPKGAPKKGKRG